MSHIVRTLLVFLALGLIGCHCGDEQPDAAMFTGKSKAYALHSISHPELEGIIKFVERRDSVTLVALYLKGTTGGNSHPVFIHANNIEENGEIILSLNPVQGRNGISETVVKQMDNGTLVNYEDLLELNGNVNVHMSHSDMETILMQGNIGN